MTESRHERTDISVRGVLWFAVALAIALVVIILITWVFKGALIRRGHVPPARTALQPAWKPPGPRLQRSPRADLEAWQAAEGHVLHSYGWMDRSHGVIRIPIEQAMELTVQRGLPVRPPTPAQP